MSGADKSPFAWRITNVHRGMYCLSTRRNGEARWHDDCLASKTGCKKALRDLRAGTRQFHRPSLVAEVERAERCCINSSRSMHDCPHGSCSARQQIRARELNLPSSSDAGGK